MSGGGKVFFHFQGKNKSDIISKNQQDLWNCMSEKWMHECVCGMWGSERTYLVWIECAGVDMEREVKKRKVMAKKREKSRQKKGEGKEDIKEKKEKE
jgi:hypothetical protein